MQAAEGQRPATTALPFLCKAPPALGGDFRTQQFNPGRASSVRRPCCAESGPEIGAGAVVLCGQDPDIFILESDRPEGTGPAAVVGKEDAGILLGGHRHAGYAADVGDGCNSAEAMVGLFRIYQNLNRNSSGIQSQFIKAHAGCQEQYRDAVPQRPSQAINDEGYRSGGRPTFAIVE